MRPLPCCQAVLLGLSCPVAGQATQFVATSPASLNWFSPTGGALDDFDRDGDPDLVFFSIWGSPYAVLRNDGLGEFTPNPLPWVFVLSGARGAFVDFDGDNDEDLFLSWPGPFGSSAALFRYIGGGNWIDASANLPPMSAFNGMAVGDFDGDGDQDILGCGQSLVSGMAGILTNQGGTFTWASAFGGQQVTIGAGDVDGDGDLDVVTTLPLQLWRNDGGMVFTNVSSTNLPPLPSYWAHTVFADVDGDGDQDLLLADEINSTNQFDRLLRNNGSGVFTEVLGAIPPNPGIHSMSASFVDVDGDGDLDLVRGGGPCSLCLNNGSGTFTLATGRLPPMGNVSARALTADLDRDGDIDILLLTSSQPGIILWNRHRHVAVPAPPAIGQSWTVELWGQPGYGVGTRAAALGVGLARLAQPAVVPPLGALWLDLGAPFVLLPALIAPGAGAVPLSFAIPPAPSIVGVTLHVQGLIEETAGVGDMHLTQLVSATIH